jgi:leucine dehydrogenase
MSQISLKNEGPRDGLLAFYSYKIPVNGLGEVPGFIAIANLINDSALGGWRTKIYPSLEMAIMDDTRLARDMRLKFGVPKIPMGGAKSCTLVNPRMLSSEQNEQLCDGFGEILLLLHEREGIRYITGKDIGRTDEDMTRVSRTAPQLVAVGSPSGPTALGVFHSIQAVTSSGSVAIEGLGAVGMQLAKILLQKGYSVVGFDSDSKKCEEGQQLGVVIEPNILEQDVNVFSCCAGSFGLNPQTIPLIKAQYVIGSANIELEDPERDSVLLQKLAKIHIPGFVVNVGGAGSLINGFVSERVDFDTLLFGIEKVTLNFSRTALAITGRTTYHMAKELAEANILSMENQYRKEVAV